MSLVFILAGLEQAFQFVGVAGASRFGSITGLVLSDGAANRLGQDRRKRTHLVTGDLLIGGGRDVPLGQVRQVGGAGLLGVMPQREERGPLGMKVALKSECYD